MICGACSTALAPGPPGFQNIARPDGVFAGTTTSLSGIVRPRCAARSSNTSNVPHRAGVFFCPTTHGFTCSRDSSAVSGAARALPAPRSAIERHSGRGAAKERRHVRWSVGTGTARRQVAGRSWVRRGRRARAAPPCARASISSRSPPSNRSVMRTSTVSFGVRASPWQYASAGVFRLHDIAYEALSRNGAATGSLPRLQPLRNDITETEPFNRCEKQGRLHARQSPARPILPPGSNIS